MVNLKKEENKTNHNSVTWLEKKVSWEYNSSKMTIEIEQEYNS